MLKSLTVALTALLLFAACTRRDTTDPWNTPALAADSLFNLAYDSDTAQKLDLYLPQGRSADSTPLLIVIHGGAWMSGDKRDMTPWVQVMRQRLPGWAIANTNYRLASATPPYNFFPAQETDLQLAVKYLYDRRMQHHYSDRIVLLGYSSGGQLALLHSYKRFDPVGIKAAVALSGPSDMADLYQYQPINVQYGMQLLMGGTPTSNPTLYAQSSAKTYVASHVPQTFLVQGGLDSVVPYTQTAALQAQLQSAGVRNSYIFYPNEKHVYNDSTLYKVIDTASHWLQRYVH
ncbi:alpha/beta hydrolase [Flaviaesturariibacter flavus]|uniref:Alpha/beta hydrolase n=1 Tax=Flaviaesturariibacter flavus TaxID=2502780 RepID=A0A4R1BMT3_9BACT|nr:alpha/beta hydrolase [Flaviaesturariibacter flavus]TCJ18657.1 alpha/beta hydrolase [Flaviaesturariibacter flavus]